jgi:ribosomal protein L37AE/L43A
MGELEEREVQVATLPMSLTAVELAAIVAEGCQVCGKGHFVPMKHNTWRCSGCGSVLEWRSLKLVSSCQL